MTKLDAEPLNIHAARPIEWLWKDRLVASSLNLIVGNEGVGKGTLVAYILAKLTKGKLNRNPWEKPRNVAIVGNEDSFHHVWGPRLWAVGVDAKRVFRIKRRDIDQVEVRRDIQELADIVAAKSIKVLYFDQFLDNLSFDTDHYNAKQVRTALSPLSSLAEALEVTVIATLHPNKRAENFRQLVQGSSAFNAISRSSLLVADHPELSDTRVLLTGKSNYGVRGKAVEFKIIEEHIRPNGRLLRTSRVVMGEKSSITVQDLLAPPRVPRGELKKDVIAGRLEELLGDGQWHLSSEVMGELVNDGYAERTVQKVAQEIHVGRRKRSFQGGVEWRLAQ